VVIEVPNRKPGSAKPPLAIALHVSVPGHVFVAREVQDIRESKNDRWAFIGRAFEAMERQLDDHQRIRAHNVKNHESAGETGRVVRLSPGEDSGFIEVKGGPDLYFTRHACNGDFDTLEIGSLVRVTRAATESPFGPQASSVQRMGVETARRYPPAFPRRGWDGVASRKLPLWLNRTSCEWTCTALDCARTARPAFSAASRA
jgi:hypothetical protein